MKTTNTIKNFAKRVVMALVAVLTVSNAWGDLYSFTFASGDLTTSSTSFTKNDVTWTLSATENQWNGTANKIGYVFGSASTPKPLTVETSGISGTITEVTVTGRSHKSGQTATVSVTVGSTDFTTTDDEWDNGNNQTLTFTGSATGTVSVHIEPDACGHVLLGISVTYSSGPSTYTVNYVVSPTGSGSISGGDSPLAAGATKELTATPASGYKLSSWSVSGTGSTLSSTSTNPTTLTVGTAATTVTANFSAVTYTNYRTLCAEPEEPTITVSPGSITNLDYIVGQGPSAAQNITLGGSNLTAGITITAPTNFEVSTDGGSTYGDSRTVTQTGGEPDVTTVKVRLKADRAVNTYGSSNVTFASTGATTQNVAVTGHVLKPTITATPNPVSWSTAVGVAPSTTSVTVTGVNMKANITAEKGGTNASDFTISPASITQTSGSASGSITITYTGAYNAVTTKTATLTLSSTDADDVVVNITFNVINDPNLYFLTDLEDIGPKDKVIIVSSKDVGGASEVDYALKNATTTSTYPPDAVDVEDMIAVGRATLSYSGTDLQWNIDYNKVSGEFTINRNGDDDVFLWCRDDNKGLSVGTEGNSNVYNITSDYIKCNDLTRYLGVYNNDDWRTYTSNGGNIADQTFTFYVQKSTDPYVTLGASFTEFTYEYNHGPSTPQSFTVSGEHLSANLVVTAPSNYQVCKTIDGTYTSSVSFTPSTGTVSEQTVYIRLAAGKAVGTYNVAKESGLSVTSGVADAVKAAVNGSVTPESFTVTATSSNVSYGTVSPASQSTTTNMTITASPVDGYRVVSGAGGYTVTAGTASVTNNGDNTFTVTPSTDCTVRINFEAIPTHKVAYWATGTKIQESDVQEGAAIPDQTTETASGIEAYCGNRDHFVGWTTNSSYSHATDAPAGMITGMSPGGTMSTSDVNYYAVYANTGSGGSTSFTRVTDKSTLADGDVIAIVAEQSGGQIFGTSADHKGGGAPTETDGKITVASSTNYWKLEASSSDWKLHKGDNNADILCADLTYTAYGNAMSIVDAQSANYFYVKKNSNSYLEYWSNTWQFYTNNSPNNGNIRLKIYKQDPGYVDYTTQCCSLLPVTGVTVSASTNNSVTLSWTLPASTTGITKFQVIDVDNANNVVKDNISTSATTASITSLTKCNTYHYKVVSYSSTCTVSSATVEARPYGDTKTVTFNYNGGSGSPASFTTSCVAGESTTLPTPDARDGYTFLGWWSAQNGGNSVGAAGDSYTVTGNTTIWAHWTQNYSVTYDRVGGTNVCANETCGAGLTYTVCGTEPTKSGYIFGGWLSNEATPHTYNAGETFTMPAANVTLTAQWTANWRNLTFNVPTGGGSITGGPANNRVLDNHTFTFPSITGKSDAKWCWTFVGWTETAPNGSGTWDVTPSYVAGETTSAAITSNKTYHAVYTKTGAGASGDNDLTGTDIATLGSGGDHAYGTTSNINATDGSTWSTNGYVGNGQSNLRIKYANSTYYNLKTPTTAGNISTITINYQAVSSDSRTIYFNTSVSTSGAVSHTFDGTYTSGAHDVEVDVSSLESSAIYIFTSASSFQINSVNLHYGPPTVYGYTLDDCGCQVTQFDLTYNANTDNFPSSTISCANVDDYVFAAHGDEYTFCDAPTLAGYRFLYWAENANGSGNHWNAGETVTCLPSDNLTVYAYYEAVHTVTFDNQGVQTPVTQASAGAAIDVPAATSPCSAEWAFVGWSETAIAPMSMLPTIEIASGTSTYTPTADKTLYAIYRKTSTSDAFVAGMSGTYKITNGSTVYAGACNNSRLPETNAAGAAVFYIKYTSADGGKYTIQQADGKYLKYAGSSTSLALDDETPYYWTMTKNGDLWHVLGVGSDRYLQYSSGTGFKAYNTSGYTDIAFVAAEGQYYYRTMSCASEYDITFHANGTTINWASGHLEASYKDLANGTVISTFPTATYGGWTFLGWRTADYTESTTAPTASGIYSTGGNSFTIASSDVDLYPVFTRFEDNAPFDEINGGDYFIYFLEEGSDDGYGGERRVYAATYADSKRYNSSALCAEATEFTFTKLANGNWTIYDKTKGKYLYGVEDDDLKHKDGTSGAEWTLTVHSGNEFDAFHVGTSYGQITAQGDGTSATFMNYRRINIGTNPDYHRVYLGGCTNRTFTTNPSTTPYITMNGDVAPITSSQNGAVRATSVLSVSGGNLTPSTGTITISSNNSDIYFSLSTDKNFAKATENQPKSEVTITANGSGIVTPTPVYVHYKPSSNTDTWTDVTVTASYPGAVSQTASIDLRTVKENFVIASKVGGTWYALPANMSSAGVYEPVAIEVDESSKVAYGPSTVGYKMWPVQTVNGGTDEYASNGNKVRFAGNSNAGLWTSGSNNNIQNNATITAIGSTAASPATYEWTLTTADRETYTLYNANASHYLDIYRPTSGGNAGKLIWAGNDTYETNEVHFFPLTERAVITIIPREWKSNGLVFAIDADNTISLTSGHTTAKIGTGEAASATLTRHSTGGYGLYEVALPDLTSHYGKVLTLKMKIGGVDTYAYATIPIIVTGTTTTTTAETPFTALDAASKDYDVVILDGAKLTTNATASQASKFQNFYVYSGGTWINDNGSTSFNYLELRGGIKGIGAKDSHVQGVPHVLLNKAVSSTAGANLDMTVYTDHGYALSVPFDVDLSKVNFANSLKPGTGAQVNGTLASQFWIRKYDGAVRAANGKGGWVDLEPEEVDEVMVYPTIHAGEGYTLQGKRPKGQPFAVIRFPFSGVGSWADSNGEVAKANIPIYAHDGSATTPDNDKGWNLIANPYMATIAYNTDDELTWAASFKVGSLEKTDGDTWDGKYQWKNASNAYVTIPNDSYTAYPQTRASKATFYPFKNFFIQASSNGVVAFVRADRSEIQQRLMAQEEQMAPIFADINLAHGGESAQAGLTIDADATTGYKFGEDYTIFESREALDYLKVYTIADGHYLVGNTLTPEETAELIPLEFYAPNTEGAYVFSLDDDSDIDRLEYMILYDAELGLSTNLLTDNYTVNLGKTGLIENRFSIGLKIRENQNTPTGTDNVNGETDRPFKFIYQDKMYILRGGVIYDATGKRVMEINK